MQLNSFNNALHDKPKHILLLQCIYIKYEYIVRVVLISFLVVSMINVERMYKSIIHNVLLLYKVLVTLYNKVLLLNISYLLTNMK